MLKCAVLTAADELLYLCSLPVPVTESDKVRGLISRIQEWAPILRKAVTHRLQSRLYLFLKRNGANTAIPPEAWLKIEQSHWTAQARVLALEAELTTVLLPAFEKAKIDILLLKGVALNQTVYREKAIRAFGDLDLLIHPNQLSDTEAILKTLRYENVYRSHFPSRWHERALRPFEDPGAGAWVQSERNAEVDLHVELFERKSPFFLPSDWPWEDAETVSIGGYPAFLPSPNRLFIHLLFHLAKHLGAHQNFFGWYLDLDACLRHFEKQISGPFCAGLIRANRLGDKLLEIFAFLKTCLHTPLPKELDLLLKEKKTKPLSLEGIFSPPSEVAAFRDADWKDRQSEVLADWGRVSGIHKKIWFILRWVFPDADYLRQKYPFRNPLEKAAAYLRHTGMMILKGASLAGYAVRKRPK